MTDQEYESLPNPAGTIEPEPRERRNFLLSLGKWSKAVIGGVVLGGLFVPGRDANAQGLGWANSNNGDRTWVNLGGGWGWGPDWYNGGWNNRPWHNGGWNNRPWYNRGGWHNRRHGGGSGWHNRHGGGSWINR